MMVLAISLPNCLRAHCSYYRYYLSRLIVQAMREVLVECDEMRDVYVAVVLFGEHIFAYLISIRTSVFVQARVLISAIPIYEDILEVEL